MTSVCLQGDCLELMKDLSNNSIDLFMCDLPYGCLTTKSCKWDIKIDLEKFWIEVKRLSRDEHTPIIMFCNTKFGVDLITSNSSWFRYELVWNKNMGVQFLSANKMPMKAHELIYVFSKKGANYNRIDEYVEKAKGYTRLAYSRKGNRITHPVAMTDDTTVKENLRCSISVINFGRNQDKKHPTTKPIDLYDWLFKRYSNEGDTVLDPTAGSFNSGVSALALNRNYIGMELNEEYYNKNKLD
jgi:site-specific DNA-methyltransferase (adenine-specific)|tara:strand:+ start:55 stop:780 length:726 start_codon:yes stop_codon:yes gene_type:complete